MVSIFYIRQLFRTFHRSNKLSCINNFAVAPVFGKLVETTINAFLLVYIFCIYGLLPLILSVEILNKTVEWWNHNQNT